MIIRCPECEHTRSIPESKIPATAELATCPRCKRRFRFRTLHRSAEQESPQRRHSDSAAAFPVAENVPAAVGAPSAPKREILRPQSAFNETRGGEQEDIWDAVETLNQRWQAQIDLHVVKQDPQPPRNSSLPLSEEPGQPETTPVADASGRRPDGMARQSSTHPHAVAGRPRFTVREQDALFPDSLPERVSEVLPETARFEEIPLVVIEPDGDTATHPDYAAAHADQFNAADDVPAHEGAMRQAGHETAVFPYSDDGPLPEERVAHDMLMLRDNAAARPMRDLGKLREYEPDNEQSATSGIDVGIPWENPAKHGWIRGFMATVHGVMFRGPGFYSRFTGQGSLAPGYLFFLVLGYLSILCSILWAHAASALLPELPPLLGANMNLPVLLLLAPVALGLMLLFASGCIRTGLRVFAPDKADFGLAYKIVSYSVAPFVLCVVPFVGPVIGALWFIIALITGCRAALELPLPLAVFLPVLPAAMLLGGLFWYFL